MDLLVLFLRILKQKQQQQQGKICMTWITFPTRKKKEQIIQPGYLSAPAPLFNMCLVPGLGVTMYDYDEADKDLELLSVPVASNPGGPRPEKMV